MVLASKLSTYSPLRPRAPRQGTAEAFATDHASDRPPPPVGAGLTAGAHWLKIVFDIVSTSDAPHPGDSCQTRRRSSKIAFDIVFSTSSAPLSEARRRARRRPFKIDPSAPSSTAFNNAAASRAGARH